MQQCKQCMHTMFNSKTQVRYANSPQTVTRGSGPKAYRRQMLSMLTMTDFPSGQEYLSFMYPEIGTNELELRPLAVMETSHASNTFRL